MHVATQFYQEKYWNRAGRPEKKKFFWRTTPGDPGYAKDDLRRKYQQDLDNMLAVVNRRSKEVGEFMKQGNAAGQKLPKQKWVL